MYSMINRGLVLVALGSSAALLVGCGEREPAQDASNARTTTTTSATYEAPGSTTSTRTPMDATRIDETFGGGTGAGVDTTMPGISDTAQSAQSARPQNAQRLLTDPEIVAFTNEAHYAELAMAEVAKRKATDRDVKEYAAMMLTQHRDAQTHEKSVTQKAKLAPAESAASAQLASERQASLDSFKNQSGKAFDRAYIDAQVSSHQRLLDAIDNKLLPSASSSELKTVLTQLRTQVAMHLSRAQEIKQKLGS
jgi:putative membrane protein